jgi:hypothetical protein
MGVVVDVEAGADDDIEIVAPDMGDLVFYDP